MKRWVVHARTELIARHALTSYNGVAEVSHEHCWTIAIRVGTDHLSQEGMAVDFEALHTLLNSRLQQLDHSDLNQHPAIGHPTPTAERFAEVVADWLTPEIECLGATLLSVSVWEGPDNRVDFYLDHVAEASSAT
jgi:6-pyruvoyltetrahydropterin/6-carboxytetrahydropterin synthase